MLKKIEAITRESKPAFARRVYEARTQKELSLGKLSKLTGVSGSAINLIENCKRDPSLTTAKKLATILEIEL